MMRTEVRKNWETCDMTFCKNFDFYYRPDFQLLELTIGEKGLLDFCKRDFKDSDWGLKY